MTCIFFYGDCNWSSCGITVFGNQYHILPSLLIPHNVGYLDLYFNIEGSMTCIFFYGDFNWSSWGITVFGNQYHIFPSLLIPHNVGYLDLYLYIEEGMTCIFFYGEFVSLLSSFGIVLTH